MLHVSLKYTGTAIQWHMFHVEYGCVKALYYPTIQRGVNPLSRTIYSCAMARLSCTGGRYIWRVKICIIILLSTHVTYSTIASLYGMEIYEKLDWLVQRCGWTAKYRNVRSSYCSSIKCTLNQMNPTKYKRTSMGTASTLKHQTLTIHFSTVYLLTSRYAHCLNV